MPQRSQSGLTPAYDLKGIWTKLFSQLMIERLKKSDRNSQPFQYNCKGTSLPIDCTNAFIANVYITSKKIVISTTRPLIFFIGIGTLSVYNTILPV